MHAQTLASALGSVSQIILSRVGFESRRKFWRNFDAVAIV